MPRVKAKKQEETEQAVAAPVLTSDRLRELLTYDPKTGIFRWRVIRGPRTAGAIAGTIRGDGYGIICVDRVHHYAHRLAWLYVTGVWPKSQVDHVNGDTSDDRISNLRECTNAENSQNLGRRKSNASGVTGVYWDARRKKWHAQIRRDGVVQFLGRFLTLEEAHEAYLAAKREAHLFQPIPREMIYG